MKFYMLMIIGAVVALYNCGKVGIDDERGAAALVYTALGGGVAFLAFAASAGWVS